MRAFVLAVFVLHVSTSAQLQLPDGVNPKSWNAAVKRIEGFRFDKEHLKASLFANKEQVHDPAAICFDDQNRLYVCESMRWRKGVDDNRQRQFWFLDDISSQTVEDRLKMYKKWQSKYVRAKIAGLVKEYLGSILHEHDGDVSAG